MQHWIIMIHAIQESIPPVRQAFGEVFPEAEAINLLDESLLTDFRIAGGLNPTLRRHMCSLIRYGEEIGAHAVGLACSVYAPSVETARQLVNIPVVSSYEAVMAEAVELGRRVGLIATNNSTIRDAQYYLEQAGVERGSSVDVQARVCEELFKVMRSEGEEAYKRLLAQEIESLGPEVDAVVLAQFSMASALSYVSERSPVPVLSAPHASVGMIRRLLNE